MKGEAAALIQSEGGRRKEDTRQQRRKDGQLGAKEASRRKAAIREGLHEGVGLALPVPS